MILGIDYGLKNIGLAISEGSVAEPYKTVSGLKEIEIIVKKLEITKIIVGVSEGKSKQRALAFGKKLGAMLRLEIEYVDETLSSYEAGPKAHAKAAAIILQRYLDENV